MAGEIKLTLSVIKAHVGGFIGHTNIHPELLDTAKEKLHYSKEKGLIVDFHVLRCGDDLELDWGIGVCGKEGQSVPVGVGQPTLKVDSLTVGGTSTE